MKTDDIIDGLVEQLAAIEHTRWAKWQGYVHSRAKVQPDGSLIIPAEFAGRWERQIETPYDQLSEPEKESDREQVRKYLDLIKNSLRGQEANP